ncbi:MAG: hypothetical protein GF375_01990 [Candidatus Omnitrophica bacterium]|nr:hypothetical protein [Candidatus Omnitrophota bacterium]
MKKLVFVFLSLIVIASCASKDEDKVAIRINGIDITVSEFEKSFEASNMAYAEDEGKKTFLDMLISRKLILKEAEEAGLDKDPEFLSDIQLFWEQSLLKRMLARKIKELAGMVSVSEEEINEYYQSRKEHFADSELEEVYDRIRWVLLQRKQEEAVKNWIESLRDNAEVKIDYQALGIETDK